MAHHKRNGKLSHWRSKKANHGRLGGVGKEKNPLSRYRRRKDGLNKVFR